MLICFKCGGTRTTFPHKCKFSRITYWVRVSDSAFTEVSPAEICEFMSQGIMPEIRIMGDNK